jgi:inorganic pyrophosphatase
VYASIKTVEDVPELTLRQIQHFFEHYKDLEKGKWVKVEGWEGVDGAKEEILNGVKAYEGQAK